MDFHAPAEWAPMSDDAVADRGVSWWARCDFVDVDLALPEAAFLGELLRRGLRRARVVKVERVQNPTLWARYATGRHLVNVREGDANERWLFHGTCAQTPADVCNSDEGLDPRFSSGGFYGCSTYLAESAAYPVGGFAAATLFSDGGAASQLPACPGPAVPPYPVGGGGGVPRRHTE